MGTVRAELAFPLENRGRAAAAVARGVEEAALALGIATCSTARRTSSRAASCSAWRSGAALAGRPRVVLLDEPTSQLDPVAGDELLGVLRRLNEEWGTAVRARRAPARALPRAPPTAWSRSTAGASPATARRAEFLAWAARDAPALQTPGARLFALRRAARRRRSACKRGARGAARARAAPVASRPRASAAGGAAAPRAEAVAGAAAGARARAACGSSCATARPSCAASTLALAPGETVALMGRNGAGKSTLLRVARRAAAADARAACARAGRVALLLQNPGDYFLHERVGDEAPAARARGAPGSAQLADRHPRDLSGGERQRLALAIVLATASRRRWCALDEPTRGMDRGAQGRLAARLRGRAAGGRR